MAKTAHLMPDSPGIFALKSTYDAALVALIKSMPAEQRAWHATRKVWRIHWSRHSYVIAVLQQLHYDITDEVKAEIASEVQQTPPGIWMLAGNPDVGRMQAQCPVCWNRQELAFHTAFEDVGGTTHLQFYSEVCGHIWELCLQTAFGRLLSWTEVVQLPVSEPAPESEEEEAEAWPDGQETGPPPLSFHDIMEARQRRLQTFDFDAWLEQAMDDD
jgi:hypothetical protein